MILPIYAYGSPVLRQKAAEISPEYPGLTQLIADMYETMAGSNGIGLAAPQIGMAIRLFVVDGSEVEDIEPAGFRQTFINPVMLREYGDKWDLEEGCLSIPNVRENVSRHGTLLLRWQDEDFQTHETEFSGMAARIIQHEYDHIEGILFTDRISPLKRSLIKNRLNNISAGRVNVNYRMKFPKAR
jgi:peptide deformylase